MVELSRHFQTRRIMSIESSKSSERLIPIANAEALGLGVGRRTIGRRIKDLNSGFPNVITINGRGYVTASELQAYKSRLIVKGLVGVTEAPGG
jgi:hypothetical protein